jgi:hypothetical protein
MERHRVTYPKHQHKLSYGSCSNYKMHGMSMSMSRVRDLATLINWPFVPHVKSWEPYSCTEVPDGPQAYDFNILWLQEKGAQVCMSE